MKKNAQSLIEFVFIFPLIIIILLGIVEYAIFYKNVSVIEDIATEASVLASRRFVLDSMTCANSNYNVCSTNTFNVAVKAAIDIVMKRRGAIGVPTLTFKYTDLGTPFGLEPYALYQIDSIQTKIIDGVATPIITIMVDYRSPEEEGIIVQLIYQYRTLFVGAQFPVLGGAPIVLIPRDIPISSSKVTQYLTY